MAALPATVRETLRAEIARIARLPVCERDAEIDRLCNSVNAVIAPAWIDRTSVMVRVQYAA
jgi:hypothetical protein